MSTSDHPIRCLSGADLRARYNATEPVVIDGASIEIPVGRISVLIGPNGSGKSTLLKLLARQLEPEAGRVILDRREITELPSWELARKLGILFQENVAPHDLTVEELTYHGRHPHRRMFESLTPEDHTAVEEALRLTDMDPLRDRPIGHLSAGQRQLAWIALALAQSPHYLFLDEPTTFLDPAHQFDIMDLVLRLKRELGKTLVLVLHDLNLAARYADHLFALRDGKIVASGTPAEILTPETLRRVFDIEARIIREEETGTFLCVPVKKAPPASSLFTTT
ncbi:MAG: ABC transporter ATP-binding protein [Methylacidiphilales bacterium]|nr:ABC transporter ATP-binding protein [Candidatus Methylacidiphilales bacterium]